jgi:phosphatidylglycerol:prolipoprotein diacylglycerol transferase
MYAIGRSIVEMYRGDEARGYVFNGLLSHSQFIAILVFLATVWVWRRWSASDQEL